MSGIGDELVDVIGADGTIERVVTRREMRAARLRHRAVGIAVRRPGDGAVLAHQRAPWKEIWPSYWDLAFGGVCGAGESFEDAARRELAEEAGVVVDAGVLRFLGEEAFDDDTVSLVAGLFEVEHEGPFDFVDGEVERIEWVRIEDLPAWLDGRDVVPDTMALAVPRLLASPPTGP